MIEIKITPTHQRYTTGNFIKLNLNFFFQEQKESKKCPGKLRKIPWPKKKLLKKFKKKKLIKKIDAAKRAPEKKNHEDVLVTRFFLPFFFFFFFKFTSPFYNEYL